MNLQDRHNQIKDKGIKEAEIILNNVGIPMCFGDMQISSYDHYIGLHEFQSEETIKKIEQEHISKMKASAEQAIQCANCKLFEKCFKLTLIRCMHDISYNLHNISLK